MKLSTNHLLICTVLVSGCMLAAEPAPPVIPEPAPVLSETYTPPYCPLDRVEIIRSEGGPTLSSLLAKPTSLLRKGTRPLSPAQVVTQAQKAARVEPSERGYFGSGEQSYAWAPGKVYTVYLSKKQATGIFLPPGEKLVSGLYLDPEAYEVKTQRAGGGESAYDALMIRPLGDSGEVQAFLLTESGKRFLLHLVVGNVGMLAVTFEGPPIATQTRAAVEPPLILPRPSQ